MAKLSFNKPLCKGCGLCVTACPKKLLSLSKTESNANGYFVAVIENEEACIGCAACATMCPDCVIEVER